MGANDVLVLDLEGMVATTVCPKTLAYQPLLIGDGELVYGDYESEQLVTSNGGRLLTGSVNLREFHVAFLDGSTPGPPGLLRVG